jgi:hypothetical protein
MKQSAWIVSAALLFTASAYAVEPEPAQAPAAPPAIKLPGWQSAPSNVNDWADRCTDSTVNGWGFKDPRNFPKLLELFSDPAIYLEFAKRMQDPESYARVVGQMLDPATAKNYLEWSDPGIYTRWLQAIADPNFYSASLRPLTDPGTLMRWAALPIDQRTWSLGLNTLNPGTWLKWATAGFNPKVVGPLVKAADPTLPLRWLQTAGNPANLPILSGVAPPASASTSFFPAFPPVAWVGTSRGADQVSQAQQSKEAKR